MTFTGMDVAAVRQMATQMETTANDISQQMNRLTTTLQGTDWKGPDANAFREEWNGSHTTSLKAVVDALNEVCRKARANADAQETTSAS